MNTEVTIDKRLVEIKPGSFIILNSQMLYLLRFVKISLKDLKIQKMNIIKGRVGKDFNEDQSIKISTDMVISGKEHWKDIDETLFTSLAKALSSVKKEYDFFKGAFKDVGYAIQRTNPGEFFHWHIDADNPGFSDRQLVAIWYLNDVQGPGGETEFLQQNVKVKPESGKLILFPPFWTHEHRGVKLQDGIKYIATTWIVFKQ